MPKVHEAAILHLTLRGVNLTNVSKGWFGGTSSPAFKVSAFSLGTSDLWQAVKKSMPADQDLNPQGPAISVSCQELCGCDLDRPIQIAVFDQDKAGGNVGAMGAFETTVSALLKKKVDNLDSVDVSKLYTLREGGREVGMVAVVDVRVEEPEAPNAAPPPIPAPAPAPVNPPAPSSAPIPHVTSLVPAPSKTPGKNDGSRDRTDRSNDRDRDSKSSSRSKPLNENTILYLQLEGVELANVEGWLGCSDPFFQIDGPMNGFEGTTLWQNVHRSEHIPDSLNPKWGPVQINLDLLCQLDLDKKIRISVYDWEEENKHRPMGHVETTVNSILKSVASKQGDKWDLSKAFIAKLGEQDMGKLVVVDAYTDTPTPRFPRKSPVPSKVDQNSIIRLTMEGVDMSNVEGWMGCSDPFFQVETPMKGVDSTIIWQQVHRSEHIENSLNPRWKPAEINLDLLCQLDLDKPLRISIFDWEESGRHNPMGHFVTSVNRLLRSKAERKGGKWDVTKAFITKSEDGEEFGKLVVVDVSVEDYGNDAKGRGGDKRNSQDNPKIPPTVDKYGALVLTLEGVDMANVEGWFGCSDPMFSVAHPVQAPDGTTSWTTIFQSEYKADNLNPRWEPAYLALEPLCQCDLDKPIRITLEDWEENGAHNKMGHFDTSVNRLLRSKADKQGDKWDLTKAFITKSNEGEEFGKIVVVDVYIDPKGAKKAKTTQVEQQAKKVKRKAKKLSESDANSRIVLSLEGANLANVEGFLGCSDPFFVISTSLQESDGSIAWFQVYRSEEIRNTLDPKWEPASIDLALLCQGNYSRKLKVSLYDWEEGENHRPMGEFETSTQELYDASCGGGPNERQQYFTLLEAGQDFGKIFVADAVVQKLSSDARAIRKSKTNTKVNEEAMLEITFEGVGLANVEGWFGCSGM